MHKVDFDSLENYYQRLVCQYILDNLAYGPLAETPGALEDVACLALNQLPSRYVRHTVDTAFYISVQELQEMQRAVEEAVLRAARYVAENPRSSQGELPGGILPD